MNSQNRTPHHSPFTTRALLAGGGLLLALASPALMRADPLPAPLIQYNFDEGTFTDVTSSANSGTLGASANLNFTGTYASNYTWADPSATVSGSGSALVSNGTSRSAQPGFLNADASGVSGLSAFTVTLWVNLTAAETGNRWVTAYDGTPHGFYLDLQSVSGNSATLRLGVNSSSASASTTTNILDGWIFIAVTYDGTETTNNVSFYTGETSVAASLLGTTQSLAQGSVGTIGGTGLTSALRVNGSTTTSSDRSSTGAFDDIRIYNGALDASQIESIRSSALAVIPEPSSIALIFAGASLLAAGMLRRRRR